MANIFDRRDFALGGISKEGKLWGVPFCFAAALCFSVPALCDSVSDASSDAQLKDAFTAGLGKRNSVSLDVARFGHHWLLTGYDRTGRSEQQLTCLLCTRQEATAAAAFLGKSIGRKHRMEPASSASDATTDLATTTVSINRVPVPPIGFDDDKNRLVYSSTDNGVSPRIRWAVAAAGMGLSAAVIGGVFLWMDGKCASSDCTVNHYLKGAGIGLVVSGALLETAAIVLWRTKRKASSR